MRTWKSVDTERLKLRWIDVTRKDMTEKLVKIEESQDRRTWRLKTRCYREKAEEENEDATCDECITWE